MRLTAIRLVGFKSFVDPTHINLMGRLLAVVGPNGCGKSNLIDAVRWVLGESSAKQLRGESMQDVIFNGATSRPKSFRASVELVFDNSDRKLQGEWGSYNEVAIKRVLTRQGDSSYYINNQSVRKKDITDLFLGTGVGQRGYAVIEQGMISRIIESKPEELRYYLEEAAGVSKYKERRRETESRLNATRDNLARLNDLQEEVEKQVDRLKRQAQVANRFKNYQEELARLTDILDYLQFLRQDGLHREAGQRLNKIETEVSSADNNLSEIKKELFQVETEEEKRREEETDLQEEYNQARERRVRIESRISNLREQEDIVKNKESSFRKAMGELQESIAFFEKERDVIAEELMKDTLVLENLQDGEDAPQGAGDPGELLRETTAKAEKLRTDSQSKRQEKGFIQKNIESAIARIEKGQNELEGLKVKSGSEDEVAVDTSAKEESLTAMDLELEGLDESIEASDSALEEIRSENERVGKLKDELRSQEINLSARIRALGEMRPEDDERADKFWDDFQVVNGAFKALSDGLRIEEGHTEVVSAILRHRMWTKALTQGSRPDEGGVFSLEIPEDMSFSLMAKSEESLASNGGAASGGKFVPNGGIPKDSKISGLSRLRDKVKCDPVFEDALDLWLGGAWLVTTREEMAKYEDSLAPGEILVTPALDVYDGVAHYRLKSEKEGVYLKHMEDTRRLQEELDVIIPKIDDAINLHNSSQVKFRDEENRNRELKKSRDDLKGRIATLKIEVANIKKDNELVLERKKFKDERILVLEKEISALKEEKTENEIRLEDVNLAIAEMDEELAILDEKVREQREKLRQHEESAREKDKERQALLFKIKDTESKRDLNNERLKSARDQLEMISANRKKEGESTMELVTNEDLENLEDSRNKEKEVFEKLKEAKTRIAELKTKSAALKERLEAATQELEKRKLEREQALLQEQSFKIHADKYMDNLKERNANIAELALTHHTIEDIASIQNDIGELARKIQTLGSVNLNAVEELKENQERAKFYQEQREDIESAIRELESAMANIDGESRKLFEDTFNAVNFRIKKIFPTMFGGGEAHLELTDEGDTLNSGVTIMARPPGKKNSSIYLLSGGEKALTAMSLVFSLFLLNPAPFCLLDEVDAPLDDANTMRFSNLVKDMSETTQFLYISHNQLTMQMADQLVGVTMQEKGVSRVVAVNLEEAMGMLDRGA